MHKTCCSLLGALSLSQVSMLESVGSHHQEELFLNILNTVMAVKRSSQLNVTFT